jgi:cytochrome c-type biogenesis protein CcmH
LPPGHPPVVGGSAAGADNPGHAVSGTIAIAASLRDRQTPRSVLFVIARSAGSGQILAVRKEEDVRFPFAFSISGADAMMEGTAFTGPFDLTARLSKTGDAMPGKGDVEGTAKGVAAGSKSVAITLDKVRQ